jgi:hypothetical protein
MLLHRLADDSKEGKVRIRSFLLIMLILIGAQIVWSQNQPQQEIVVTPMNTRGWSEADTRPGGDVEFVADPTAPSGYGALKLTTDASFTAKAQFMHEANTPLVNVNELSYYTKQDIGNMPFADPSYQLVTCLGGVVAGGCVGFTTLVFEPYQNPQSGGPIIPGTWQEWDVDEGQFWSSRTFAAGTCAVAAGAGGPPFYTLDQLKLTCPNAVVIGFGVNIGSNNPNYTVYTDLFNFNGTVYDFELFRVVRSKDECKNGGWRTLTREDGTPFRNQGDCVSYANHNPYP